MSNNHIYEHIFSTGRVDKTYSSLMKRFLYVSSNKRDKRDFMRQFKKNSGRDIWDSGLFKNFRDGTKGIRDTEKFVSQISKFSL
jgi:hypothetical protein